MSTGTYRRTASVGIGMAVCLFLLLTAAMAAPNMLQTGTFQGIETNGLIKSIVITKGEHTGVYRLSGMAQVYDGLGRRTTIDTYMLPSEVEFLVEYTERGPVIKKIREIPQ